MEDTNDIESFRKQLEEELGDNFTALVIYGSHVSELHDEFSDTDLCIVVRERDEETIQKIREATNKMQGRKYFVFEVDENEFKRNVSSGDVFYKYEVLGKGRVLHERDGYISDLRGRVNSEETDFSMAEQIHRERYEADKDGLRYHLEGVLDRLKWEFTDLVYLRFAKTQKEPRSMEEVPEIMNEDEVLAEYANDFKRIMELNKAYRHHRIKFPFGELKYFSERVEKLERGIGL